jgi:flagellar hook-associated protein 1 FlgK
MSSAFLGITTLSSALEAFQTQINVTGQNIANVNTAGYVEQSVNLTESPDSAVTDGSTVDLGSGVSVDSIVNIQSSYLDAATNNVASDLGSANAQAQTLSSVNSIVADPNNTGLGSQIDGLYNSFSSLASNATSANKLAVQQAAQTLSSSLNSTYGSLDSVKGSATQQLNSLLQQAQTDINQIATLNKSINEAKINGSSPNDLIDQRDQAVTNLSSLINVTVNKTSDGTDTISSGNLILVDQSGARTLPTTVNAATGSLTNSAGQSFPVTSGQIGGLMSSINKVDSYESNLDTLATQISSTVNAVYAKAANSSGQTGQTFFTGSIKDGTFGLSSAISSNPSNILTGTTGAVSDTSVAQQIANLGTTSQTALGSQTPSSYYASLVSQIGSDGQTANTSQSTQEALSTQVAAQVQSVSGVNVDTEMSNLLRFQSSYQAAAQALSGMDQSIQTLLTTIHS